MHEKIALTYENRVKCFLERNIERLYSDSIPLTVEFAKTADPVKFADRLKLKYKKIQEGEIWGKEWESAWFHLTCSVPKAFSGKELCLRIHTGGEGLLFDIKGEPICGLTGFSVFSHSYYYKDRYILPEKGKAGAKLEFWFEAAANGLFGVDQPAADDINPPKPTGSFSPMIKQLKLCVFDREYWGFYTDLKVLYSLFAAIGDDKAFGKKLLHAMNRALDIFNYNNQNAKAARKYLKETIFKYHASDSALTACTVGHAHIDVGWLWPVRESTRKAARTFSSQLELMDRYPDYTFGASQAYLYKVVKENYPGLYKRIKQRVKEGRWEIQGGMWVESDCNIISGESMVRQFLHAKNFFKDEFGFEVKNLWIPDVFGYSASMPQIIKKAGCDYFLTQKMSWSFINEFPHHTFRWAGVDGTEIITHFPPEATYNADIIADQRYKAQNDFKEAGYLDEFISLAGIGDGGGGPSEDFIERGMRMKDLENCPKHIFGRADEFFKRLEKHASELPRWNGELYLELHRGTLTTQAHTKRNNRKCEQALTALEILAANLPPKDYPAEMLDKSWKTVLLNQFHDIIPGSSIGLVYKTTEAEHAEILKSADTWMKKSAAKLFRKDSNAAVAVNTLSYPWSGCIELPWKDASAIGPDGKVLPVQKEGDRTFAQVSLPADSFVTIRRGTKKPVKVKNVKTNILENEYLRCEFAKDGTLASVIEKESGREVLSAPANVLSLYYDRPVNYENWDVDLFYPRDFKEHPALVSAETVTGPVRSMVKLVFKTGKSTITQNVILGADSRRLDFVTHVDWRERRVMLRTAFPVNVHSDTASYDIQYAYTKRPTVDNTSWDEAKFECCGQRYADLSDHENGAALLNDCKYGYRIKGSTLDLNLLRSPAHPDYFADLGEHDFTYSFLPHKGSLIESNVMSEAAQLNRDPWIAAGLSAGNVKPVCTVESEHVSLEIVKKAEKDDSIIIRLVETSGKSGKAVLKLRDAKTIVSETDLMEWKHGKKQTVRSGKVELEFKPFEIRTFRLE